MFEDYYIKATQAADALSTVEGMLDNPKIGSAEPPQRLPAVAAAATAAAVVVPVVPPSAAAIEKEQRRVARKAEREAKIADKRERAKKQRWGERKAAAAAAGVAFFFYIWYYVGISDCSRGYRMHTIAPPPTAVVPHHVCVFCSVFVGGVIDVEQGGMLPIEGRQVTIMV